jgi:hypothetical protein
MKKRSIRGISIVEMLLVTALLSIIIPMVTSIFVNVLQDYQSGISYIAQQDSINSTFMSISSDFERSSSVSINIIPGQNISNYLFMRYTNPDTTIVDDKIAKKFYFKDNPSTDKDQLRVINSESGVPQDVVVLDNILVKLNSGGLMQKSAIKLRTRSPTVWDIWMEIYFNDINTTFFKGRNFSAPVIIRFDTSSKNIKEE